MVLQICMTLTDPQEKYCCNGEILSRLQILSQLRARIVLHRQEVNEQHPEEPLEPSESPLGMVEV